MRVRVKICGITNPDDAELVATLGADAIGLNFYAQSPRVIDATTAFSILHVLPPFVEPIALFVNESCTDVERIAGTLSVRTVQLHGEHREPFRAGGLRWIPAFAVHDAASLQHITSCLENWRAVGSVPSALLVDARVPGLHGGTGQTAPWHLLADFKPGVPLILAGGLTPDNVADAIRSVRPYAVDVASGVESRPGKKDADKLRRFIAAVQGAGI